MNATVEEPVTTVEGIDEVAAAIARRIGPAGLHRTEARGEVPAAVLVAGNAAVAAHGFVAAAVDDDICPGPIIRYAAAEARRRGVALRVVHVWTGAARTAHGTRMPWQEQVSKADLLLSVVPYDYLPEAQAAATEREILHDADAGRALIALSAEAGLMVVAARSTPAGDGDPLGQTVRALLGRTACPLAVLAPGGTGPVTRAGR